MAAAAAAAKPAQAAKPAAAKPAAATFSASAPQSDQQLQASAHDIANTQVNGGLSSLAQILARNQAQTAGAQKATAGLYQGLGANVQTSNDQIGKIGAGLNQTLTGIGQQSQQSLGQAFQPGQDLQRLNAQGLGGGGTQALAAELARQQGYAAQDSGAFRSAGATQGANYQSLGASNLGTFSTKGLESIVGLGRAGQARDSKVTDAQLKLEQSRGPLYAQALGKLTDSEANRQLARATLGIKGEVAQTGVLNARTGATRVANEGAHQVRADQTAAQNSQNTANYHQALVGLDQIKTQIAQGNLSEKQRHDLASEKLRLQGIVARGSGPGGTRSLSPGQTLTAQMHLAHNLEFGKAAYSKVGSKPQKGSGSGKDGVRTQGDIANALRASGKLTEAEVQAAADLGTIGTITPAHRAALVAQGVPLPAGY